MVSQARPYRNKWVSGAYVCYSGSYTETFLSLYPTNCILCKNRLTSRGPTLHWLLFTQLFNVLLQNVRKWKFCLSLSIGKTTQKFGFYRCSITYRRKIDLPWMLGSTCNLMSCGVGYDIHNLFKPSSNMQRDYYHVRVNRVEKEMRKAQANNLKRLDGGYDNS